MEKALVGAHKVGGDPSIKDLVEELQKIDKNVASGATTKVKAKNKSEAIIAGVVKPEKKKYYRSKSERKKALLRDAEDQNSALSQDARDFIRETDGKKVPDNYEVSHEVPLYTAKTTEGKKALDVEDNMKTIPKDLHRARHRTCGDQFHDFPR
ncbi:UNVERIFIED_CONTAM: hypothetical protein Cloal_3507 [Acetivibrio alkalicellulosi]